MTESSANVLVKDGAVVIELTVEHNRLGQKSSASMVVSFESPQGRTRQAHGVGDTATEVLDMVSYLILESYSRALKMVDDLRPLANHPNAVAKAMTLEKLLNKDRLPEVLRALQKQALTVEQWHDAYETAERLLKEAGF